MQNISTDTPSETLSGRHEKIMEPEIENKMVTIRHELPLEQEVDFCTMGMFILDEIHYLPPKPSVYNVLGGGGAYSALGARILSPAPLSKTVSWVVDAGSDFPPELATLIDSWNTSCLFRTDLSRLTTRGWNGYDAAENRGFKYTTPKLRLTDADLSPSLLFSRSFHLLCNPTRCIQLCTSILRRRKALNPSAPKPIFIWEPVPDLCIPDELLNCTNALPYVDICSPNANELAGFLGDSELDPATGLISRTFVERACEQLLSSMPLQSYTLVIRCGAQGCYVAKNGGSTANTAASKAKKTKKSRPANRPRGGLTLDMDMFALFADCSTEDDPTGTGTTTKNENEVPNFSAENERRFERDESDIETGVERWLPAYFTPEDDAKEKVVDPTGGGNGFLGGMAVALARGRNVVEAAAWGSVAASFMIEQVGVPVLSLPVLTSKTEGGANVDVEMASPLSADASVGVSEDEKMGVEVVAEIVDEKGGDEEKATEKKDTVMIEFKDGVELWNGESVEGRLEAFRERCGPW